MGFVTEDLLIWYLLAIVIISSFTLILVHSFVDVDGHVYVSKGMNSMFIVGMAWSCFKLCVVEASIGYVCASGGVQRGVFLRIF